MNRLLNILLGACVFALVSSVVSFVDTKEVAVIYRLGEMNRIVESGIHLHLPFLLLTVYAVTVTVTVTVQS